MKDMGSEAQLQRGLSYQSGFESSVTSFCDNNLIYKLALSCSTFIKFMSAQCPHTWVESIMPMLILLIFRWRDVVVSVKECVHRSTQNNSCIDFIVYSLNYTLTSSADSDSKALKLLFCITCMQNSSPDGFIWFGFLIDICLLMFVQQLLGRDNFPLLILIGRLSPVWAVYSARLSENTCSCVKAISRICPVLISPWLYNPHTTQLWIVTKYIYYCI